jgi:carbon-monoxide dehydrogenase large subunit
MDGTIGIDQLALTKFGIGQPVPRNEDPMLVCGQGRYTDDINLPGQAYAVIFRSRYAHGVINVIDTEEARAMPGVLAIYTEPDLTAAGMKPMPLGMAIPTRDGTPMHRPARPVLTSDRVRYVGDPVAIVIAETAAQAKDAAEAVLLDVETLPAVHPRERSRGTWRTEIARRGAGQCCRGVPLR